MDRGIEKIVEDVGFDWELMRLSRVDALYVFAKLYVVIGGEAGRGVILERIKDGAALVEGSIICPALGSRGITQTQAIKALVN